MRRAVLAAALLLPFASSASAAPTKDSYIRKADQLCRSGNAKLAVLEPALKRINFNSAAGITKAAKLFNREFKLEHATYQQLIALPTPAGDHAVLMRVWGTVGTQTSYMKKTIHAMKSLDVTAMNRYVKKANAVDAAYRRRAEHYGFHYCGVK